MEQHQQQQQELISVAEAAEMLRLAPKTVYNGKAGTARLLRVRLGRSVRLVRSEVEEFKREQIEEAASMRETIYGKAI